MTNAAKTEAEMSVNTPGTAGIPKLKARRFSFNRESNHSETVPTLSKIVRGGNTGTVFGRSQELGFLPLFLEVW